MFSTHCWTDPIPAAQRGKGVKRSKWHYWLIAFTGKMLCPDCAFPDYASDTGSLLINAIGLRWPSGKAKIVTLPSLSSLEPFRGTASLYVFCCIWAATRTGPLSTPQYNNGKLSPVLSLKRWNQYDFLCSVFITQGKIHWAIHWVPLIFKKLSLPYPHHMPDSCGTPIHC